MTTGKKAMTYMNSGFRKTGTNIGKIQVSMSHAEDPFEEDPRIVLAHYLDYFAMRQGYGESPKDDFIKHMNHLSIVDFKGTADSYEARINWSEHKGAKSSASYIVSRDAHDRLLSTAVYSPMLVDMNGFQDWNDVALLFPASSDEKSSSGEDQFSYFLGDLPIRHPEYSQFDYVRQIINNGYGPFSDWILKLAKQPVEKRVSVDGPLQPTDFSMVDFKIDKGKWHATAISSPDWFNNTFDHYAWEDTISPYFVKLYHERVLIHLLETYGGTPQYYNEDKKPTNPLGLEEKREAAYIGSDTRIFNSIDWFNTRVVWDITHTDKNHISSVSTYLLIPFYGLYDSPKLSN